MVNNDRPSPMLDVKNLFAAYGNRTILEDISFSVDYGEIFIILGESGCGKSTLLKHLIGLISPQSGNIFIQGEKLNDASLKEKNTMMRHFGVLYQSGALFGSLTVAENINLVLEENTNYSKEKRELIIKEKLGLVGLDGFQDYMPSELSGGMKKRAGLARAMVLNPKLLFFDEPSAGLDPISSAGLDRLILDLREKLGTTMIIVTHELESIFTIADRAIMLKNKKIIAEGHPSYMRDHTTNEFVKEFLTRDGLYHGASTHNHTQRSNV